MLLLFLLFLFLIYFFIFTDEKEIENKNSTLEDDGYLIFDRHLTKYEVINRLPKDYVFLDYKYSINGCTLSTFHRDVTSSQYVFNSKYPVYTYICYYNEGKLMSLCPGSHKQTPFLFRRPKYIKSDSKRTSVLFNCDLVHSGYLNKKPLKNRKAIQYKIVHKEDLEIFKNLHKINKIKNDNCRYFNYNYELFLRKMSLFNSYIVNHVFTEYLQNNKNDLINKNLIKIFNKNFYNK